MKRVALAFFCVAAWLPSACGGTPNNDLFGDHGNATTPDAAEAPRPPVVDDASADAPPADGPGVADANASTDAAPDSPSADGDAATLSDAEPDASPPLDAACTILSCGTHAVCIAGACAPARRVFVSSAVHDAKLGGTAGGDALCATLATAAGLGGAWKAWLSETTSAPVDRFAKAAVPYRLVDGTTVAADWAALVAPPAGVLAHAIDVDERGQRVANAEVWTGTASNGTRAPYNPPVFLAGGCAEFQSNAHGTSSTAAAVGLTSRVDSTWSAVYEQYCDRQAHVYCVEQ